MIFRNWKFSVHFWKWPWHVYEIE